MFRLSILRTAAFVACIAAGPAFAAPSLIVSSSGNLFANGSELWPNLGDGDVRKAAYRGG